MNLPAITRLLTNCFVRLDPERRGMPGPPQKVHDFKDVPNHPRPRIAIRRRRRCPEIGIARR
jgi:hypothetical protein